MEQRKKQIITVDDHPLIRLGIKALLSKCDDYELVAEATNSSEFKALMEKTSCDLVILDMKISGNDDGIQLLEYVKHKYSPIKVIIMSQYYKKNVVQKALNLGVDGYITKEDVTDTLLYTINRIFNGERVISPKVQAVLLDGGSTANSKQLTKREKQILKLFAEGLSRKDIALKLGISLPTVDFHKTNITIKLNVTNIVPLINKAKELGLI